MAKTLHLDASDPQDVAQAAKLLRAGGTVAFPTETVYGLGANALSGEAVARIFAAKERPSWDPLIVHVPSSHDAWEIVRIDEACRDRVERLAAACWPGPLTLLLPRSPLVPDAVTAGRTLVGVRVPAHPAAQALLQASGLPLAAPSANRFGHISPTTAQHVLDDLGGRIDAVLDAGPTTIGLESSVLDPAATPMVLYRPGAFTAGQLAGAAGAPVRLFEATPVQVGGVFAAGGAREGLPAPGIGIRHYAPRAKLLLTEGNPRSLRASVTMAVVESELTRESVGVLLPVGWELEATSYVVESWAPWDRPEALAAQLYSVLRALDTRGVQVIYCPMPAPGGLRDAIRDRLQKAARLA